MTQEEPFIPIEDQLNKFNVLLKNNNRLFFSAKFGDGKTTFLNEFKKEKQDEYQIITLFPINYQIVDNKDIFELIKRDILLQLFMLEDIVLNPNDVKFTKQLCCYFKNNYKDLAEDLLVSFAQIYSNVTLSPDMHKAIKCVFKNINKFKTQQKEREDKTNELKMTDNFLDKSNVLIYEFDAISRLIYTLINQYREKTKKEIVLIIEDLDRIDPKHLFRLLNIFSAHFDRVNKGINELDCNLTDNKFGFDKIVFVCDYDNIENIFHHFYGNNTDFKGYITKFSSAQPFRYSLKELYIDYICSILPKEISQLNSLSLYLSGMIAEQIIFVDRIKKGENSLRTIKDNIINYKPNIVKKEIINNNNTTIKVNSINSFTIFLDILIRYNIDFSNFMGQINNDLLKKDFLNLLEKSWELSKYLIIYDFENIKLIKNTMINMSINRLIRDFYRIHPSYYETIITGLDSVIENINESNIFTNKFIIKYKV